MLELARRTNLQSILRPSHLDGKRKSGNQITLAERQPKPIVANPISFRFFAFPSKYEPNLKVPFHAQHTAAKMSHANFSYVIVSVTFAAHEKKQHTYMATPYVLKFNLKYVSFICSARKLIWKT